MRRRLLTTFFAVAIAAALAATPTLGHGGNEIELKDLKLEPASTLAEQALAELQVRHDTEEAAVRLDAALESKDQSGVDMPKLTKAMHTVDDGDPQAAIPLLDRALSRPPGAPLGTVLHETGREFQPGTDTQEIVAIIAGACLVLIGLVAVRTRRRATGR
jgi:hypothetical protein